MNFSGNGRIYLVRGSALGATALVATLLYLSQHMFMVNLGYRIEAGRKELAKLDHQRTEMQLEIARLSALARIEEIARTRLGMDAPSAGQLVRVIHAVDGDPTEGEAVPGHPVLLAAAGGG